MPTSRHRFYTKDNIMILFLFQFTCTRIHIVLIWSQMPSSVRIAWTSHRYRSHNPLKQRGTYPGRFAKAKEMRLVTVCQFPDSLTWEKLNTVMFVTYFHVIRFDPINHFCLNGNESMHSCPPTSDQHVSKVQKKSAFHLWMPRWRAIFKKKQTENERR